LRGGNADEALPRCTNFSQHAAPIDRIFSVGSTSDLYKALIKLGFQDARGLARSLNC
jgi:hypothetical protein